MLAVEGRVDLDAASIVQSCLDAVIQAICHLPVVCIQDELSPRGQTFGPDLHLV